jgi:hypothetical protein
MTSLTIADIPLAVLPERVVPLVERRGHALANDLLGQRWTCIHCAATLCAPHAPVYGSATRENCPGVTSEGAYWRAWCLRNIEQLRRWQEEGK